MAVKHNRYGDLRVCYFGLLLLSVLLDLSEDYRSFSRLPMGPKLSESRAPAILQKTSANFFRHPALWPATHGLSPYMPPLKTWNLP